MQKLITVLCVILSAGVCIAAQNGKSVVKEVATKKPATKSIAASKAIGVEQIRAVDHVGENRYALIVGINDYLDDSIPDLKTCQADALAMYELLTDPAKGGIKESNAYLLLGEQATSRNIRIHLGKLRRIPSKSTVFVYFSGHGCKEGDEAYWVAQDSQMDDLFSTGISNIEVQRYLSSIPSDRVVVMLDCCYAAATVKGGKASVGNFTDVLNKFTGKGRAYLMAAGSGEEAIEAKDLKRSVFTHYLVEGLAGKADDNKDGVIVLTELSNYVDSHVADEARLRGGLQRPVMRMDNVTEPSKFGLTVYPEGLIRASKKKTEYQKRIEKDIQALRKLYFDKKITPQQFQLGERLIKKDNSLLNQLDRKRKREFRQLIDGKLSSENLKMALDVIQDRPARPVPVATKPPVKKKKETLSVDSIINKKMNDSLTNADSILEKMKALLNDENK